MAVLAADVERYASPAAFAREVNLPLLGTASLAPVAPGAGLAEILAASAPGGTRTRDSLESIVGGLAQTRRSLTLRSLLLAGFPHDPECFALGLAVGRAWSRTGLKIAVVDLDGWNPTVVRPPGEPSEGFVDALEYGCSFPRVAWEVVAGSLWLVGAGLHPPDEGGLTEHPDWGRVSRLFAAHADVTLYVAPFLDRPGLTGRLSKRMDAVVLAASVERAGRAELRDAFLELWGSDAPIIGSVGLEPAGAAGQVEHDPFEPIAIGRRAPSPPLPAPPPHADGPAASAPASFAGVEAAAPEAAAPEAAAPEAAAPEAPEAAAPETGAERRRRSFTPPEDEESHSLISTLEAEVRAGKIIRRIRRRPSKRVVWFGAGAGLVLGTLVAAWALYLDRGPEPTPGADLLPAGQERVLPAPDSPGGPVAEVGEPAGPAEAPSSPSSSASSPSSSASPPSAARPSAPAGERPIAAALDGGIAAGAPLTTAPPAAGMPYTVHVASFRSESKVIPIVRELRRRGAAAWYERAEDAPGWYRVFVGRFATEEEAEVHAAWLLDNEWVDRAHAFSIPAR